MSEMRVTFTTDDPSTASLLIKALREAGFTNAVAFRDPGENIGLSGNPAATQSDQPTHDGECPHKLRPHDCAICQGTIASDQSAQLTGYELAGIADTTKFVCHPSTLAAHWQQFADAITRRMAAPASQPVAAEHPTSVCVAHGKAICDECLKKRVCDRIAALESTKAKLTEQQKG